VEWKTSAVTAARAVASPIQDRALAP